MKNSELGKNAIISVYKKNASVLDFTRRLNKLGFKIYASSGTAKFLAKNKILTFDIEKLVGFPPILDHRVVTLHPKIHAGILAKQNKNHEKQLKKLHIPRFDLVCVDLYPAGKGISTNRLEKFLELIDIGGPAMLRAAAKNFNNGVVVISDLQDAVPLSQEIEKYGVVGFETRKKLSAKVFRLMEKYDGEIARYLDKNLVKKLRYGENPNQEGWFEPEETKDNLAIQKFKQLQGKELSFNNYLDIDAAIFALAQAGSGEPACVVIKHTNPTGYSAKKSILVAYEGAWYGGDPLAAFGGIVGVNRQVDKKLAEKILFDQRKKKFFEVLIAPSITQEALQIFSAQKNIRVLVNRALRDPKLLKEVDFKKVRGGVLYQEPDNKQIMARDLKIVTKKKPTKKQIEDLLFAWKAVKISKSNAICLVKNMILISSGVGQQDRKESCRLAVAKGVDKSRGKSKYSTRGTAAASDAFFPFSDGPEILIKAGVSSIIQPGGSVRDQEVIDTCNRNNVSMVFTSTRSFRH